MSNQISLSEETEQKPAPVPAPLRISKILGCLFGGAIGDALGMPVTGRTREEIAAMGGVRDFLPAADTAPVTIPLTALAEAESEDPLGPGQWTDDTQLTLALAETLIDEQGLFIPDAWGHRLVRWLNDSPRAPGLSSVQAAVQLRTGGAEWDEAADPEGGGCGAATRAAPIALAYPDNAAIRRKYALLQAMTTHGQPDAQAAALAVAEAVAYVLPLRTCAKTAPRPQVWGRSGASHLLAPPIPGAEGANFGPFIHPLSARSPGGWDGADFLQRIIDVVREQSSEFLEFARCIEVARNLLLDGVDTATAVRVLGVSAWAREAVPTALYLVARHPDDLEALLLHTVNLTGGAVESIATMVGAIGGALHGIDALPARWRRDVEDAPRLLEASLGLHGLHR